MLLSLTDVHGTWDVIAILLIVMGPIVGGAVPLVLKQRAHNRHVTKTLGAVHDNVQNGHDTPLRSFFCARHQDCGFCRRLGRGEVRLGALDAPERQQQARL